MQWPLVLLCNGMALWLSTSSWLSPCVRTIGLKQKHNHRSDLHINNTLKLNVVAYHKNDCNVHHTYMYIIYLTEFKDIVLNWQEDGTILKLVTSIASPDYTQWTGGGGGGREGAAIVTNNDWPHLFIVCNPSRYASEAGKTLMSELCKVCRSMVVMFKCEKQTADKCLIPPLSSTLTRLANTCPWNLK